MRKVLKIIGLLVLILLIGGGIYLWSLNKPLPTGEQGSKADQLAKKMMIAVNKAAWDSTKIIQWTFKDAHHFVWDKEHHLVEVKWDNNRVLLNANEISGNAFQDGIETEGDTKKELIQAAWAHFCNDAFWLNAPTKAFDFGTKRSIITQKDGSESLLVSYESGGVTPGDAYLWHLDDFGMPTSYQMWVSIIPVKCSEVS